MNKTTCNQHRVLGYAYRPSTLGSAPDWVCRGCGLSQDLHETLAETYERNQS